MLTWNRRFRKKSYSVCDRNTRASLLLVVYFDLTPRHFVERKREMFSLALLHYLVGTISYW